MNESVTALSKTPGTAIGTAYRDIIRRAANECSWLKDGDRAYDIDIDGKTVSISTLFENLIGIILPEAYVGNARFGVQDDTWFASCDIVYVPGLAIKAFDDLGIQADPANEIEFSIDGVDNDPKIHLYVGKNLVREGGPRDVRMYPEDLGTLRETLLAHFNFYPLLHGKSGK
jgi:hypothetical protein